LVTVRSGGAKPRFSKKQRARIVALAQTPPRDLGLSFTSWTLHKLADQACKRHIVESISHECVRQILMDADCDYRNSARPRLPDSIAGHNGDGSSDRNDGHNGHRDGGVNARAAE
jgi:hypothetical protein